MTLPTEAAARKNVPIFSGVLMYFPDALAAVAECSKKGNDQHNPGKPLHWDRSKSQDEHDALVRHLMEAGTVDTDGIRHSAKVAWRALAALQKEIERGKLVDLKPVVDTGWTPWHGETRKPPVHGDTKVDVKLRRGELMEGYAADLLYWKHGLGDGDVVAWRHAQK